jgi:hypothetical protein
MAPLHGRIIDAWMQHPTARSRAEPIFEPLRRWFPTANLAADDEIPLAATIEARDAGGVRLRLVCAWWGPCGRVNFTDGSSVIGTGLAQQQNVNRT